MANVPTNLLVNWFEQRGQLHDLRAKPHLSDSDESRLWLLLNELVAVADDIVASVAPNGLGSAPR
ncbi:hypothetical protein Mycsm_07035 (plasmid) [Mycobacterium sp. JS623]|uniref:hypothetical protein n=1 Tax=Mycobacterium sp. JS623 TaxID=212767 RepID=UPI0002A5581D|nr:hypothetical protein [Mycobacterium sp. JS623]AGB27134.1 hypothetical protein Mycsm_07035 [Mycobacterium sp. JS623]